MPGRLSTLGLQPRHAFSGEELRKPHFTARIHQPLDPVGKLTRLWKMFKNQPFTLYSHHFCNLFNFHGHFSLLQLFNYHKGLEPQISRSRCVSQPPRPGGKNDRLLQGTLCALAEHGDSQCHGAWPWLFHDIYRGNPWKKTSPIEVDCWV